MKKALGLGAVITPPSVFENYRRRRKIKKRMATACMVALVACIVYLLAAIWSSSLQGP